MVLSQDEIREQVKAELRNALAYFIERQKLVAQAMMELGLDLNEVGEFGEFGPIVWAWNPQSENIASQDVIPEQIEKSNDPYEQKMIQLAIQASERKLQQSGIWIDSEKNDWKYFLHGSGCLLVNLKTGEPIDWNCPDVNRYDIWKFMSHLMWQLSSLERTGGLISTRIWASHSLEPLVNEIKNERL